MITPCLRTDGSANVRQAIWEHHVSARCVIIILVNMVEHVSKIEAFINRRLIVIFCRCGISRLGLFVFVSDW